jgi:hypothetical protein
MGLFSSKSQEDKYFEKIGKYLLDGEKVEVEFGNVDKAYITNKRVIFKNISISLSGDLLEMVFIPFSKIDGVSYVELNKMVFNRAVRIKSRGFSHDMGFTQSQENECIEFCKKLSEIMLSQNN